MKSSRVPIICILTLGVVAAQETLFCGQQLAPYLPFSYSCLDDLLCPIVAGYPYKKCGSSCYSDLQYNCTENNILEELPLVEAPYQVAILRKDFEWVNGKIINPRGSRFVIGKEPEITCPLSNCTDFKNITVFAVKQPGALLRKSVALDVVVPGGQEALIGQLGDFIYSIPHGTSTISAAYKGPGQFRAYKGGEFVFTGGNGWHACLVDDSGSLHIVQQISGVEQKGLCVEVILVTKDPGAPGPFAWEY